MERTGAMKAFLIAYLVALAILALFLLNALGVISILEMEGQGDPSGFAWPLAVFGVQMLVVIFAAAMWPRAPRTPWFWLVGAIPGLLFFLPDIPIIIRAVTSPESVVEVVLAIAAAGSSVALLVSAAISFRDARRLAESAAS
jgi:hypothetical protein